MSLPKLVGQVPGLPVRRLPTAGVPVMVGYSVGCGAPPGVAPSTLLSATPLAKPGLAPVTWSEIDVFTSATVKV